MVSGGLRDAKKKARSSNVEQERKQMRSFDANFEFVVTTAAE